MKSSLTESGSPDRKFSRRLKALWPRGPKKTHRFSANVTGEEDWDVDEPQIRMSRAFAVMLILHLVAVGGLFAFHMFGKDDRAAEDLATRKAHESSPPPPPAAAKVVQAPSPVAPRAEIVEDEPVSKGRTHSFKKGETRILLAAKFGITVRQLEDANPDKAFVPGDILTIPQPPRVIGAVADAAPPANPPLALIVATPSDEVPHREFALKEGAENPYGPVNPEDMEEEAPTLPAPVVRQVKAQPLEAVRAERMADEEPVAVVQAVRERKPTPAPAAPAKPKPKPATGSRTHVVQKGDTIYNVARRYSLSPNEVLRANGISDPSRLQMGQVLKITVKR